MQDPVIYVVTWDSESGDKGVVGYWTYEPSEDELTEYFREIKPDEFFVEDGVVQSFLYWDVHALGDMC